MQSIKTVIGNVRFSVNTALKSAKCMRRIGQVHEGSRDFVRVDIRQVTKDCLNLCRQRSLFYFFCLNSDWPQSFELKFLKANKRLIPPCSGIKALEAALKVADSLSEIWRCGLPLEDTAGGDGGVVCPAVFFEQGDVRL